MTITENGSVPVREHGSTRVVPTWQTLTIGITMSPIIVLGVLGNLFSLFVWVKGRRRKTSTARYLSALAVADMIVLLTVGVEFWISYVLRTDIKVFGTFPCKFLYFMNFFSPSLSAWILVAVTIERALSVWIPHKINVACRPVTAGVVTGLLTFVLCLVYLPIITGVDVVKLYRGNDMWLECNPLSDSIYSRYLQAWFYVDLCVFFVIPFGIMLVCNVSILAKVGCIATKRRSSLQERTLKTTKPSSKSKKMLKTVTRRIVILCITYLICNCPLVVLNVILTSDNARYIISEENVQYFRLTFHVLMYVNNGVNFLLYCMIGSGFRKDFIGIFRPSSRTSTTR